jgi:succinyl-diaminopimelate desuccinylase
VDNYSNIDQQLSNWIDAHADELIKTTQELLRIPSVKGSATPGAPYGVETARALTYTLGVAEKHGLTIRNLDGYAGHAELRGDGVPADADIVGVLAHVDVVPEGDGWKHPAFGGVIDNGILYGRGAVDDKGPAVAGLYAILALAACKIPVSKRIRLILGTDEESGFGCVAHYFANEEMPVTGFTPDGRFPVIFAEKGIANLNVEHGGPLSAGALNIVSLRAGRRSNMVPDLADAVLTGTAEEIERFVSTIPFAQRENVDQTGKSVRVAVHGISAHGSTPKEGVNAVVVFLKALEESGYPLSPLAQQTLAWAEDTTGGTLGIAGQDEIAGELTSNLGIASYESGKLSLTFNIRYPVSWTIDDLLGKATPVVEGAGAKLASHVDQAPLYVPVDDPLLETLLDVYRSETGDNRPPLTMGGGTYARVMRKGVAFGPEFDGPTGGAHQPNEHWPMDHLIRATKIYARALARLANQ